MNRIRVVGLVLVLLLGCKREAAPPAADSGVAAPQVQDTPVATTRMPSPPPPIAKTEASGEGAPDDRTADDEVGDSGLLYAGARGAIVRREPRDGAGKVATLSPRTLLSKRTPEKPVAGWQPVAPLQGGSWDEGWVRERDLLAAEDTPEGLMRRARSLEGSSPAEALRIYEGLKKDFPGAPPYGDERFSDMAEARMGMVRCLAARKGEARPGPFATPQALVAEIEKHLRAGAVKELTRLADCDFEMTVCNSDAHYVKGPPAALMGKVLATAKKIAWPKGWKPTDADNLSPGWFGASYASADGKEEYRLVFDRAGGWRWRLFCTSDDF